MGKNCLAAWHGIPKVELTGTGYVWVELTPASLHFIQVSVTAIEAPHEAYF